MTVSTAFVAAPTNRFSYAADASPDSSIALGSGNLVGLWDITTPNDHGILGTLPGHDAVVTCVRFLSNERLVTGDEQGMLFLWKKEEGKWKVAYKTKAHDKALTSVSAFDNCIVSGSSDSTVKIWEVVTLGSSEKLQERQTISTGKRYPLGLALICLPDTKVLLLAVSGTDTKVQLYLRGEDLFIHSASLAGHEDWVRALSFRPPPTPEEPLILASGSQDATIRLWSIEPLKITTPDSDREQGTLSDELLDAFEASLGEVAEGEEGGRQISLKRHILTIKSSDGSSRQFSVAFDALLIGHEFGITSLSWRPDLRPGSTPTILSSSTDSSLILWSPSTVLGATQESSTSIWINRQRFGDVGGQRLGGFVGALWARGSQEAIAWGWAGGWRRWSCTNMGKVGAEEEWQELGAISGHRGPVKGLAWSPNGEYLISTGVDQTTRVYGELFHSDVSRRTWHEIARPQVHGYDLLDAVFLDPLKFISIADEKVARVFEAPRNFVQLAQTLDVAHFSASEVDRPAGASVPPLGLSNKAVGDGSSVAPVLAPSTRRPFEGELAGATLWPEIEKIFGHGYESITLAVSHSRKLIATACKATSAEHAVVRVYETNKFRLIGQPLAGHALTVTRVAFSPDDRFILSVSRDRSWHLFESKGDDGYVPITAEKSHGRIIWDCAWSAEGDVFATASRDKTVKIWKQGERTWTASATIKTPSPATAVDFSPVDSDQQRKLAVGLEDGSIQIFSNVPSDPTAWKLDTMIDTSLAHVNQIHRLSWRPTTKDKGPKELASCSEDGTLKVLIIQGR
ncbi:WD40 repeat-like protein [Macrolepiota fuliginosa MF-IS2]|uniref:Elongator complex protein 2 n=1 Tax=Macrolepiota fuliginosa MF-IS2 TaxID=1400762 RepID=A0A9P5XJ98_9AGAR|nr:WD40 repeat-like protein [Macrolepiota fuliginosa MF-IS2]